MLSRLEIIGFQRWEKLRVRLDPQCTTFTGISDTGKTSILRAIRWWATNRPTGDAYIHWGMDRAVVKAEVDGHTVTRRRGPGYNEYRLDGKPYRALGRDVPPAVAALLNLGEVNFQWQHDPAYWFSASPGEVSRNLNAIVNLDIIDRTLTNLGRACNRANVLYEDAGAKLTAAKTERAALAWVPAVAEAWEEVEWALVAHARRAAVAATVGGLVLGARQHAARATAATAAAVAGRGVLRLATAARKARNRADAITAAVAVARVKPPVVPDIAPLARLFTRAREARARATITASVAHAWACHEITASSRRAELEWAKQELAEYTKGVCPTCGAPLKPS